MCVVVCLAGCGDNLPADRPERTALDDLVDMYEDGQISRDGFRAEIAQFPDYRGPMSLSGRIEFTTLLTASDEPYRITGDLSVDETAILVIEDGAVIEVANEVNVDVLGRVYAIGSSDLGVTIRSVTGERYDTWFLRGGPNQLVHVAMVGGTRNLYANHPFEVRTIVDQCRFDSWSSLAIGQLESSNLFVYRSQFGYDTPADEEIAEAIRTRESGHLVIHDCEFSKRRGYRDVLDLETCLPGYWPEVIGNRFDGGEDDAIDLDACSALVIGNTIRDFRPADLEVQVGGVNGGGVTGDREGSHPFVANNLITGCFHAVGFKDGSQPVIVNNTILDSNIGITLYQSSEGRPSPHGVVVNNILAGNVGWLDETPNDIVLSGKWWAGYNQSDEVQATIDARYNITATLAAPYPGTGNLNGDPLLADGDVPEPTAGSPAIDSALGELGAELDQLDLPTERILELLETDYRGAPRTRSGDAFFDLDRGAIEAR